MKTNKSFDIRLADLSVKINANYDFCEKMCKDYIQNDLTEYDIVASVTDDMIKAEQSAGEKVSDQSAEFACIYRCIANELPRFSRAVFHGAAITYKDEGVLFTAKSGTGKTTHIKLWRETFGTDVKIVNGDKPIIKAEKGSITVYGTPWAGKENWQKNRSAPLKAVCVLARGDENRIERLSMGQSINELMHQIYMPQGAETIRLTLGILDEIIKSVPVYKLYCNISSKAAKLSFKTIFGE